VRSRFVGTTLGSPLPGAIPPQEERAGDGG
jgi:hypothetical protein